jgi:hypothetical protein
MNPEYDTHTFELLGCTEDGVEEWFCPSCGRHMLLRLEPSLEQTLLAEGDPQASHSNRSAGIQAAALAPLAAALLSAASLHERSIGTAGGESGPFHLDAFIDFGEPELSDGLAPWIAFLKRLG